MSVGRDAGRSITAERRWWRPSKALRGPMRRRRSTWPPRVPGNGPPVSGAGRPNRPVTIRATKCSTAVQCAVRDAVVSVTATRAFRRSKLIPRVPTSATCTSFEFPSIHLFVNPVLGLLPFSMRGHHSVSHKTSADSRKLDTCLRLGLYNSLSHTAHAVTSKLSKNHSASHGRLPAK